MGGSNSKSGAALLPMTGSVSGILGAGNKAFVVSPFSLYRALLPVYLGAAGATKVEMAQVMGLAHLDDSDAVQMAVNTSNSLTKCVHEFNAMLLHTSLTLAPDYKVIEGTELVRFSDAETACRDTNKLAETHTNGLIKDLLHPEDVSADIMAILLNTVYFKADWASKFKNNKTKKSFPFTRLDSEATKVDMMNQQGNFAYYETKEAQYVQLDYAGAAKDVALLIELPKGKATAPTFGALASTGSIDGFTQKFQRQSVDLSLPKFKTEARLQVKEVLQQLGMVQAFSGGADFSVMSKTKLNISQVIQQLLFEVDEEGTTAAAATAVMMMRCMVQATPKAAATVCCDHAFGYMLVHLPTGTPLFNGTFNGPAQ
ncbi:putative serpin-like protein R700 [Diplonema papillatum]|nr:putative serpin-like protein R700 [Diplonema papillatum]